MLNTQSFEFSITYDSISLNGKLDFSNGIYAEIETSLFGKALQVLYVDEIIYLSYDGVFIKTTIAEIKEALLSFDVNLDFDSLTEKLGKSELINEIINIAQNQETKDILNFVSTMLKELKALTFDKTKLSLEIASLILNAELTDYTANGNVQYENYLINFDIKITEIEKANITENQFISLNEVISVVKNAENYLSNGQFGFNALINFDGQTFEIPIYLDINKKSVFANTTFEGLDISLTFIDSTIYAQIEDILITANFDNVKEIVAIISRYTQIDTQLINEIIDKVISILESPSNAFDMIELPEITFESILEMISNDLDFGISLSKQDNALTLSGRYAEHSFEVLFENNNIRQIKYNGIINATLEVTDFVSITAPTGNIIKADNQFVCFFTK